MRNSVLSILTSVIFIYIQDKPRNLIFLKKVYLYIWLVTFNCWQIAL